jgi:hypothetical protein
VRTVSRAQVRQAVNARGLGRWRASAQELAPLIGELENAASLDAWHPSPLKLGRRLDLDQVGAPALSGPTLASET